MVEESQKEAATGKQNYAHIYGSILSTIELDLILFDFELDVRLPITYCQYVTTRGYYFVNVFRGVPTIDHLIGNLHFTVKETLVRTSSFGYKMRPKCPNPFITYFRKILTIIQIVRQTSPKQFCF